ncbi:WD40/YVTN/BNR-like repeat-containing protein, partial [Streptomyces sp. NPDC059835]|uniref:WD40/YVTN/BNR-like repeat-containing protein n=1 Tax=Streptomyces sp. NPDC059835 TaxID=3346967 RepID=UPI003652C984
MVVAGGVLVAVGEGGLFRVSRDGGQTWEKRDLDGEVSLSAIACVEVSGAARLVVAGQKAGRTVAYYTDSPDGSPVAAAVTATSRPRAVAGSGTRGQCVMVGDGGLILTSDRGEVWARASSGVSADLRGVVWGGGRWVAVGADSTVLTSTD